METLEIYLNSKTARQNSETSNCYFDIPNIDIDSSEQVYIGVRNSTIPYSWYNVNSNNNIVNFMLNNISISVTLTEGNYNVNTLGVEFFNQTGITISYQKSTNKYLFSHLTSDFTIYKTSTALELFGLTEVINHHSFNKNIISDIGINLFTVRQIYVTSDNFILNNINASTHSNANILCSIQVTGNPNSITHYENTTAKHLIHHLNNISNLHIKLTDQDGNRLHLNGVHWSMTLQLYIIKKI